MRSKLPRRGENSADCAKRNQASESILEIKIRHKKPGEAHSVLGIRKSFPAKKQSNGKTAKIEKNFPHAKNQKNRRNSNPI